MGKNIFCDIKDKIDTPAVRRDILASPYNVAIIDWRDQ